MTGDSNIAELSEEQIFSVLAHPVRRHILKLIYIEKNQSFSTLKSELDISTGSIYHHIEALNHIVAQNDNKHYVLTTVGVQLVEQYLNPEEPRAEIVRMQAFTLVSQTIFNHFMAKRPWMAVIAVILVIMGNLVASSVDAMILGAVIIPRQQNVASGQVFFSLIYNGVLLLIYYGIVQILSDQLPSLRNLYKIYFLALLPANAIILVIFLLNQVLLFSITWWVFAVINLISQIGFLLIISGGSIQYLHRSPLQSVVIAFLLLYIGLFVNLTI